jgi:hypothetical protein
MSKRFYDLASQDLQTANNWILLLKAERARAKDNGQLARVSYLTCLIFDAEEFAKEIEA